MLALVGEPLDLDHQDGRAPVEGLLGGGKHLLLAGLTLILLAVLQQLHFGVCVQKLLHAKTAST